ncbi:MAG: hypothetical protein Q9195_004840 [Heterodermia aff. obscurata]
MNAAGGLAPGSSEISRMNNLPGDLEKREDEDDDSADIEADGTGPIRDGTPTWYQIDPKATDADATFTSFTTGKTPVKPDDPKQTQKPGNGDEWDVDHILELQVLLGAFKAPRPQLTAIASAITNLDNLQGIPNADNGYKKNVVKGVLRNDGKWYPNPNTYFNFIGVGVRKYLADAQTRLFKKDGTVSKIGDQLVAAGGSNAAVVKTYFVSYASAQYSSQQSWISASWTGKTWDRPTTTTSSTTSTSPTTASGSTVTCEHAADPQNTCAAIASSPGWCDCGDSNKYPVMTESGSLCQWTTLPPTQSFNCPVSTTQAVTTTEAATEPTPTPEPTPVCEPGFYGTDTSCGGKCNGENASCACIEAGYEVFSNACTCQCG